MMKRILQSILGLLARTVLWRTKPVVVAVTGSVGKTTTKEAIGYVLRDHFGDRRVRVAVGNYNTAIGVPLTIIGMRHPGRNPFGWIGVVLRVLWRLLRGGGPDMLVLEFAADRPGDIEKLTRMVRPQIGVVTAVGDIPVHVEFYESPQEVAAEKATLIAGLPPDGVAIVNRDEQRVWAMRQQTAAQAVGVGVNSDADVRSSGLAFHYEHLFSHGKPTATLKINTPTNSVPLRLRWVVTEGQVRAALQATAVARALGIPLLEVVEALRDWRPPSGRMRPLKALRGSVVIDDSYNASPLSMQMALTTLDAITADRRIAVLGDMRELGGYAEEAHREIGRRTSGIVDRLFVVGEHALFVKEAACEKGLSEEVVRTFHTADEAAQALVSDIQSGDVVLVKGSRSVGLDRVVSMIADNPKEALQIEK